MCSPLSEQPSDFNSQDKVLLVPEPPPAALQRTQGACNNQQQAVADHGVERESSCTEMLARHPSVHADQHMSIPEHNDPTLQHLGGMPMFNQEPGLHAYFIKRCVTHAKASGGGNLRVGDVSHGIGGRHAAHSLMPLPCQQPVQVVLPPSGLKQPQSMHCVPHRERLAHKFK